MLGDKKPLTSFSIIVEHILEEFIPAKVGVTEVELKLK